MAISEFSSALNQVASERGIDPQEVIDTLKRALIAAYRKDHTISDEDAENLDVVIESEEGGIKILLDKKDVTPVGFGRIASQTAKQVILQQIKDASKNAVINEYRKKIGTIVQGYLYRIDRDDLYLDLGKAQGVIPGSERVPHERYIMNQKYKAYVKDVTEDGARSRIILSRRDNRFILALFEQEVPEITQGIVAIERIAREAGQRTKIAVSSTDPKIDPSGACIGQKGNRVQAVTDELNGEKIDIINYNDQIDRFIASALSPATVLDVEVDEETKNAYVKVDEEQLSLAIGNNGQNVRLAAKLVGYRLNINGQDIEEHEKDEDEKPKEIEQELEDAEEETSDASSDTNENDDESSKTDQAGEKTTEKEQESDIEEKEQMKKIEDGSSRPKITDKKEDNNTEEVDNLEDKEPEDHEEPKNNDSDE